MAARIIVVTSGKGGVGKTTTVANVSIALAKLGKKVIVIDGDIGLRNLDVILGLENRIVFNLVDVIEGSCTIKQAVIKDKRVEGLHLLPAAQTRTKDAVSAEQMIDLCNKLKDEYDFIILDSPAGIEAGFKNSSAAASEALVVATPDVSSVRDADRIIGLLESDGKESINLIINRLRPEMVKNGDMLNVDDVLDVLSIKLIGIVPDDESVVVSSNKGEPLSLAAESPAGIAFMNIARRIVGEEVAFLDIENLNKKGFFSMLRGLFAKSKS